MKKLVVVKSRELVPMVFTVGVLVSLELHTHDHSGCHSTEECSVCKRYISKMTIYLGAFGASWLLTNQKANKQNKVGICILVFYIESNKWVW